MPPPPPTCKPIPFDWGMFKLQRARLAAAMKKQCSSTVAGQFAVFQGSPEVHRNNSDTTYQFRQNTFFFHQFGLELPDCLGAVNLENGAGTIFIPRLPAEFAVWYGKLPTPESIQAMTQVENVAYTDEIAATLKKQGASTLHVLEGNNSDSGLPVATAKFDGIDTFSVERGTLFETQSRLRAVKLPQELEFLEKLNKVSSAGHVAAMQACKVGGYENQLESAFFHHVSSAAACRNLAYGAICGAGYSNAILHYIENNAPMEDGALVLCDFGGELRCFASDITTTYPVNGKFTSIQATLYNAVLAAHDAVVAALKPGVSWLDMHKVALRIIGRTLRDELGVIKGSDEELEANAVVVSFMPHGLGHLIGLDVHDVGGFLSDTPPKSTEKLTARCRTARVMEPGIYITVEPGCYFNHVLVEQALADPKLKPYLVEERLRSPEVWNFGGIRLESNVEITETGCKNHTDVPRKVEDVEAVMAGASWPPVSA